MSERRLRHFGAVPGILGGFVMAGVLSFFPLWAASGAAAPASSGVGRNSCWVIMDIESFFCPPCLQPLLDFCRALPAVVQEERVQGILVSRAPEAGELAGRRRLIVQKKWLGFRQANDIRFSAVMDDSRFFSGFSKASFVILFFDEETQSLKCYSLPLGSAQIEEIMGHLLK
jgi:hypothetical protein